ncbi:MULTISPECIES: hypothetical protein [Kribbella]|uniref:Uncharacterized protein n=2 Tax=Kribbella TaxID=182639 RepID=A0A4R0IBN7_9ACTN|nr:MULTISPECIES: hypothetical protein [Kribbella]TCC30513.1 hypothetical protein E0H50_24200 [Kribbella sindirgiensis]TCC33221.1 hypothetical protein E0H92_34315 [Kribbella speibonae]
MTALEELRSGQLGEEFAKLLYRRVLIVGVRYRFPPPKGYAKWGPDAAHEAAHEYLTHAENYPRLVELAATVSDNAGLERKLTVILRNYMRASGRRTVIGKLIRRLRGLLKDDDGFVIVADGVPGEGNAALVDGPTEQYSGDPALLRAAARTVRDVTIVRWGANVPREGPVADRPSLVALSKAVLEAAGGSLPFVDLAEVVAARLSLDPNNVPGALPVEDVDELAGRGEIDAVPDAFSPEAAIGAVGVSMEDEEIARAVLEEFSEKEKLVLAWLHLKVRDISKETGLAVSTAGAVSQRVRDKLSHRLAGMGEASMERIAFAVRDAARAELGLDAL